MTTGINHIFHFNTSLILLSNYFREMLCEAVNTLFTEQCYFTKENLELFKQKVKCIISVKKY